MFVYEELPNNNFAEVINKYHAKGANRFFAQFAMDEQEYSDSFLVGAVLANQFKNKPFVFFATRLAKGTEHYPSLTPYVPAANWYEREIHDLFGLVAEGHPALTPLVLHECFPEKYYPMRKNFIKMHSQEEHIQMSTKLRREYPLKRTMKEDEIEVPVGPIHAGIIEPGHFRFTQAGEDIVNLEAKLFYTHRGIEKATENMDFSRAVINAERICGNCTVSHAFSFSQAVESLGKVKVSVRANLLRMFIAEVERIYNHVGDIGNMCAGVGWSIGVSQGARLKEKIMVMNEILTGNRFLRGVIVPGGVVLDFTPTDISMVMDVMNSVYEEMRELITIMKHNSALLNRTNKTGILTESMAAELSANGVTAKASGIMTDMRKEQPYALYKEFDFKIPVYKTGDATARLFVRADEITQSMKILHQIAGHLPEESGELYQSIPEVAPYQMSIGWSESARGGNMHVLFSGKNNTVYRYFVRSASYVNWPCVPHTMKGNIIADFPVINKSFELCYACLDR